jgi:hypothetical protein
LREVKRQREIHRAADYKQRLNPWCKLQKLIDIFGG